MVKIIIVILDCIGVDCYMKIAHCALPFEALELYADGSVYCCCSNWNRNYLLGNINQNNILDLWNSEKLVELRKRVLKHDYSLCDSDVCPLIKNKDFYSVCGDKHEEVMQTLPRIIKFVYDSECNINCKICRDKICRYSNEELENLNKKIDTQFIPLLKNARVLNINAHGEVFASRHSSLLVKKAVQECPNLLFDFHTNGILCSEKKLKELNVSLDRIYKIRISIHAATAATYEKIVPNGKKYFPQIMKNLEFLSKASKKYDFPIFIHFVVLPDNFREIPDFFKLASKYGVSPRFWEYREDNCVYKHDNNWFIYEENHPLHSELVKVLNLPEVKRYKDFFSPLLARLMD